MRRVRLTREPHDGWHAPGSKRKKKRNTEVRRIVPRPYISEPSTPPSLPLGAFIYTQLSQAPDAKTSAGLGENCNKFCYALASRAVRLPGGGGLYIHVHLCTRGCADRH